MRFMGKVYSKVDKNLSVFSNLLATSRYEITGGRKTSVTFMTMLTVLSYGFRIM